MTGSSRNFAGYRGRYPAVRWPNGARLALSLVVNVEEGAELSIGMGDEVNESVYEAVERVDGVPDLCMESHFEYGTRAGWPRLRAVLGQLGMTATLNANGRALALSPWIAAEAVADGHEVSSHGWRWERHVHMDEEAERAVISRAVRAITKSAGSPPLGWHTRSATSANTRRLLVEHGGFLYDSNAYNDDVPWLDTSFGRPHVVLPYAFDTNDMRFLNSGGFVFGDDFARYCSDAFDCLYEEGGTAPRMMSVGLHLRIIGRPGRIEGLVKFLQHVTSHTDVWIARRDEIAHAWRAMCGVGRWSPYPPMSQFPTLDEG